MRNALALLSQLLSDCWHWWSASYISVKKATVYTTLLAALFFLLGGYRSPAEYRQLEGEVESARQNMRLFADEIARRNGLLNSMAARASLDEKTIEILGDYIQTAQASNAALLEESAFYRHILESNAPGGELIIHALDITPVPGRENWEISAILARSQNRGSFKGGYYFEITEQHKRGQYQVIRLPAEGALELDMTFYHEINSTLALPLDASIENIAMFVLDGKGNTVASAEYGEQNNGDSPTPDAAPDATPSADDTTDTPAAESSDGES